MRRQHDELSELETELASAVAEADVDRVWLWLGRYAEALEAHFDLEEQMLFPLLAGFGGSLRDGVSRLVHQHQRLQNDVDELTRQSNAYDLASGLAALRVEMAAHERLEETLAVMASAAVPAGEADAAEAHIRR